MDADKEKLANAPRIVGRDWREFNDPSFIARVDSYFATHRQGVGSETPHAAQTPRRPTR